MRKIFLFCFVVFGFGVQAQGIDVLHYGFALSLDDKSDTIIGIAFITFARTPHTKTAFFDLTNTNSNGRGMRVTVVAKEEDKKQIQLVFSHENGKLKVQLPPNENTDTTTISIGYIGQPADGLIISKNKYGDRTFFADNWPNRAHEWIPCVDNTADKASFEFIIGAPSYYKVVSNGVETEEKINGDRKITSWFENTPLPTKVMVIGAAKFATKVFEDSPKGIPVSAWVYPQDSTKGFYDYALATDILKFFSSYIAPYPYNKLANVQSKTIFGGMENASCIFYEENSVTGTRSCEDLLAHEIAHQWFGDMATEKSFAHLWLSEGFATYFTDLYVEHKYGRESFLKRLKKERAEAVAFAQKSTHPVVDTTSDLMSLLNANSYQKGAWVLHMLRQEVGDSTFHKIMQTYYNRYKGSNADTRDFEAVAEKISGKSLKWFFDQWLYRPGLPQLKITVINSSQGVRLTVEQLQKELYRFKLPVSVESTTTKEMVTTLFIKERTQSVLLSRGKLMKIIVDPECTVLFNEIK